MSVEKLANAIKNNKPRSDELSDLVYGKVTKTSPLTILVESRFEISSPFLILSQMVKNLSVTVWIDGKSGSAQVFRGLQVGDGVMMLRVQKGQKYYVLERV